VASGSGALTSAVATWESGKLLRALIEPLRNLVAHKLQLDQVWALEGCQGWARLGGDKNLKTITEVNGRKVTRAVELADEIGHPP
jgi:hypothetical protein